MFEIEKGFAIYAKIDGRWTYLAHWMALSEEDALKKVRSSPRFHGDDKIELKAKPTRSKRRG
jgi:hypothetical protein